MDIYKIQTAYGQSGNSPWDTLWYEGDDQDLDVLCSEMRLRPVWRSILTRLEKRDKRPDFIVFHRFFAVAEPVRKCLAPLLDNSVEFLPVLTEGRQVYDVLHPLLRRELDQHAIVTSNAVSGNITVIQKHSFLESDEEMHIFQVRQASGSAARDAGFACSGVLVSSEVKRLCEINGFKGVVFSKI